MPWKPVDGMQPTTTTFQVRQNRLELYTYVIAAVFHRFPKKSQATESFLLDEDVVNWLTNMYGSGEHAAECISHCNHLLCGIGEGGSIAT